MARVIVGAILGTVVLYVWGMVSWMVLPWHNATMQPVPDEKNLVAQIEHKMPGAGLYYFPDWPEDQSEQAMAAFNRRHERGPVGFIIKAAGGPVMAPSVMATGALIDLIAAMIAAWLLWLARGSLPTYAHRVGFLLLMGLFVGVVADATYWNWMHFPADYSVVMIADRGVAFLLAGLVIAILVREVKREGG